MCTQSLWLKCLARVPGEGLRGSVHWLVVLISNYKRGLGSLGQILLITCDARADASVLTGLTQIYDPD